ncbi:MAG: flavin reductase family protein [Flavobacteriales bacterium]|nr:flavin reductase family protein [Flavobacteriales bacterium]
MIEINPNATPIPQLHAYLLGAVGPRPIAFASTIDENGNVNLAPFSFFNVFSANPPILIFSPARSGRTNTTKHTYDNVKVIPEVVINIVNHSMVHQVSLASAEYPKGVSEFEKSGFTPLESKKIKPFRVKESPVQIECKVNQVIELGTEGGAGNLIICEVLLLHINEEILNESRMIDPHKIDLVARMGGNWYCRASGNALFEIDKPLSKIGIGVDAIPAEIKNSAILTGNHLGQLGNVEKLPTQTEVEEYKKQQELFFQELKDSTNAKEEVHRKATVLLNLNRVEEAWKLLLALK